MILIQVLNKVQTSDQKNKEIKIGNKTYYVCSVCGRLMKRKTKAFGHIYCDKHYKQQKKYGHPLDDNPRTTMDKNEIRIDGDISYMDLYDKKCNVVATVIFDTEDIPKVRYIKWKLSHGYANHISQYKGVKKNKYFTHEVLQTDQFVDHINHNTLDNRKVNLRIVTKSQNQINSNHKGVYHPKNTDKYHTHIKLHQKQINLGTYEEEAEACWARWFAERIVFKEYAYPKQEPDIPDFRKEEIKEYVIKKVQRL